MPMISIIIPVYNVEKYLKRCVDSVLNQTFKDFECILVDDGSTDKSGAICDEYEKLDKRVKVIHKENGGQSSARNVGLNNAAGEYVGFVDSDDWIHPQMYEYLYECSVKYKIDIMICPFEKTDQCQLENCTKFDDFSITEIHTSFELLNAFNFEKFYQFSPSVSNKLYKRKIFDDLRFEEGKIFEDTMIMIPTFLRADKIGYTNNILYYYFYNRQGSTMNREFSPVYFTACIQHVYLYLRSGNAIESSYIFEQYYFHELLRIYKRVFYEYPIYKKQFKKFLSENKKITFREIFSNKRLCKMEKLTFSLFKLNKRLALKLHNKYLY